MPRRLVFDIEANGLLDTVSLVHCIEAVDPDTRECLSFGPDRIADGLAAIETADMSYAHYGEGYDFQALEIVHGFRIPIQKRRDTVVMSRLFFPNLKEMDKPLVRRGVLKGKKQVGSHSIEAWGLRLGRPKLHTDIEDWSKWTPEVQERCAGDAMTNVDLLLHLETFKYPEEPIELEHRVARILLMMEAAGVPFDEQAGAKLHVNLLAKRERIEEELVAEYGSWYEPEKRDEHGLALEWTPKKYSKRFGYVAGAPLTKIKKVTFNPRSNAHVIKEFKKLGWEPLAFTKGGEPELKDETLEAIAKEIPDARKLAEYRLLAKRLDMLADGKGAWLQKVRGGMIHGRMNPMGTPHSRASHFDPNLAQVPKVQKLYGKECRALFGAGHHKSGRFVQVGADMSGLQQRALGHYLAPIDGGTYGKLVVSEDIHWVYAQAATLVPEGTVRDKKNPLHEIIRDVGAKPFGYAYLFGCYPKKSGQVVRKCAITARQKGHDELYERFFGKGESDSKVGEAVRKEFDERLKLGELNKRLLHNYRLPGKWKKHITGLDGRKVPCRSEHSLLNYLLSSAEAIICKTWVCDAYDALIARGYKWGWDNDFVFMLFVHDEVQLAVRKGLEKEVGELLVACAKQAGVKLGFRVPLASEYKTGLTWADCH